MKKSGRRLRSEYLLLAMIFLVVLLLAGGAIFTAAWLRREPPAPVMTAFDSRTAHEDWQRQVKNLTGDLNENSGQADVRRVRDSLIFLRVAADDREAHLAVMLALLALERNEPGAYAKLCDAVRQVVR
jgi:hypothetical protein